MKFFTSRHVVVTAIGATSYGEHSIEYKLRAILGGSKFPDHSAHLKALVKSLLSHERTFSDDDKKEPFRFVCGSYLETQLMRAGLMTLERPGPHRIQYEPNREAIEAALPEVAIWAGRLTAFTDDPDGISQRILTEAADAIKSMQVTEAESD
jgi:hypothetical protein